MSKKEITEVTVEDEAAKLEAFKQSKRDAAKRWKENKQKQKEEFLKKSAELNEKLKAKGIWDQLDDEDRAFLESCANPVAKRTSGGATGTNTIFTQVFGAEPKVGDSVTLTDIFQKTLKGKSQFDAKVKAWANEGIVISYKEDAANMFNSTYTIEALPNA